MVSSDLRTLVLRQSKTKEWSTIRLASCTNERVPKVCPERFARRELRCLGKMAGTTRLELATSAVTGQRSNQLNYVPNRGINNLRRLLSVFLSVTNKNSIIMTAPPCVKRMQS